MQNDIFKIGASYTFDNDLTISPDLKYDFGADDITKYGLQIDKGDFSANLGYDDGFTGSLAYGPVEVSTTEDGARLDLNKNIWTGYRDDEQTEPYGSFDIKGYYDTHGNWRVGPSFSMTLGEPDQPYIFPSTDKSHTYDQMEMYEYMKKKGLFSKGGLAKILGV